MTAKSKKTDDKTPAKNNEAAAAPPQGAGGDKDGGSLWLRTAHGAPFWRGGLLFDGQWREVRRDNTDETAWRRILAEPMLQRREEG